LLLAKEEVVVIGIGRCYGLEMNEEENKVISISRQLPTTQIMMDQNRYRM
jgi:hypothetical protein